LDKWETQGTLCSTTRLFPTWRVESVARKRQKAMSQGKPSTRSGRSS